MHQLTSQVEINYISHLDGLRAIAVIAVLFFHFRVPLFSGGFAGVDVFITLSGYLITSSILVQYATDNFHLRTFFFRRFVRLYPASIVTCLCTVILAFMLLPDDLSERTSWSAFLSQLSLANIYFHAHHNYFDDASFRKPLLHMWSLSLEEQFYFLLAPFLSIIMLSRSSLKFILHIMIVVAVGSLAINITLYEPFPSFTFYQLPGRAYQFIVGGILALVQNFDVSEKEISMKEASNITPLPSKEETPINASNKEPSRTPTSSFTISANINSKIRTVSELGTFASTSMSIIALVILLLNFTYLQPNDHPTKTLPLTIATLVLIATPAHSPVAKALSTAPMSFIGRLSYCIYLVHWPLYVYYHFVCNAFNQTLSTPLLLLLTLLLACLLHFSIERPFRAFKTRSTSIKFWTLTFVLTSLTTAAALSGIISKGFKFRQSNRQKSTKFEEISVLEIEPYIKVDFLYKGSKNVGVDVVLSGVHDDNGNGRDSNVVFVGNSYVGMWKWALAVLGKRRGENFRILKRVGCGLSAPDDVHLLAKRCRRTNAIMWDELRNLRNGSYVGMSNSWYGVKGGLLSQLIRNLVYELKSLGLVPFVMADTPGVSESVDRFFACADIASNPMTRVLLKVRGQSERSCMPQLFVDGWEPFKQRVKQYRILRKLLKEEGVHFLDLFKYLCGDIDETTRQKFITCKMPMNVTYGYNDIGYDRDRHHLNKFGSFSLQPFLEAELERIGALTPF